MPRCYMVKKDPSPLGGTPPCSPTEASVAPPCYTPHDATPSPRAVQFLEPARHVGTQYEEPCGGEGAAGGGDGGPEPNGLYTVLRAAQYTERPDAWRGPAEPRAADLAERSARYLERDEPREPRAAQYAEPGDKVLHYEVLAECGASPPDEDAKAAEYAELQNMPCAVAERSAADTEAAHELLSLAAGVPPLPPAAMLTVLSAPEPVLPLYTYALQPTSIYIIADEPTTNNLYATTVQTLTPLQQVEYTTQPQVSTYIIQEPQPPLQYQPLFAHAEGEVEPSVAAVPVSVIEAAPPAEPTSELTAELAPESTPERAPELAPELVPELVPELAPEPAPLSVQVSVIEPVPPAPESTYDTDSDESAPLSNCAKKNKYNCNECGKRYATSSNLSRHKQTHRSLDSQAAKRCGECGKAYVSMPALAMHVLTHRMGYVCGVCGKQFSRPWLLRGHLRSHTGEKPYNCPSCSKAFADRSNLRAHLQTHAADKRWECARCNKTFALKSYLNKHQEAACTADDHEPH